MFNNSVQKMTLRNNSITLKEAGVFLEEITHTYYIDDGSGRTLRGITDQIKSAIFPDQYSGVPQRVLDAAAERGTEIHEALEARDNGEQVPEEFRECAYCYAEAMKAAGLSVERSEFIVTDGKGIYATAIDKVCRMPDGSVVLGDIKTTAKRNDAYVSWQLSTCAEFFETQTGIAVSGLVTIYVAKDGTRTEIVPVQRLTAEDVDAMLYGDCLDFLRLRTEMAEAANTLPAAFNERVKDILPQIAELEANAKAAAKRLNDAKAAMLLAMEEYRVKKIEQNGVRLTYIAGGETRAFDAEKALAFLTPEQAEQCYKTSKRKSSIKISSYV